LPHHGKCCECVAYHCGRNELPACYFSKEAERTYDRSLAMLLRDGGSKAGEQFPKNGLLSCSIAQEMIRPLSQLLRQGANRLFDLPALYSF
jgi:hypothetical protein